MKSANPTSKPIRIVIIDDEPPARRKLHEWLQRDTAVEIVGECGNGFDALRVITEAPPEMPVDVMFLDIQMPEMSGIELLRHLSEALPRLPLVIFVTAFDRYAIEAFNLHALDYLLKPYDEDRFQRALDRAKSALEGANSGKIQQENLQENLQHQLHALLASYTPPRAYQRHFTVKSRSAVLLLKAEELDFVSAEGNYVALHRGAEEFLIREPLSQLEQRLDPAIFARIHRSTLVNVNAVHSFLPASHGDYVVVLKSGVRLDLSRQYREKLNASLGLEL